MKLKLTIVAIYDVDESTMYDGPTKDILAAEKAGLVRFGVTEYLETVPNPEVVATIEEVK